MSKTQKYEQVKSSNDIQLKGIEAQVTVIDNQVKSVHLVDAEGHELLVRIDSYALSVSVPAKPKMVKRYRLKGTVLGLPVEQDYEYRHEAESRQRHFEDNTSDADREETKLSIEEVEVPEES